jgi:hypothetical protein
MKKSTILNDRFVHGTYVCSMCGKRTRDTGIGEESVGLCAACLEECEMENAIADGDITGPQNTVPGETKSD